MTLAEAIEDKKRTLKYLTERLDIKTDSLVLELLQEIDWLEELLEYRKEKNVALKGDLLYNDNVKDKMLVGINNVLFNEDRCGSISNNIY